MNAGANTHWVPAKPRSGHQVAKGAAANAAAGLYFQAELLLTLKRNTEGQLVGATS